MNVNTIKARQHDKGSLGRYIMYKDIWNIYTLGSLLYPWYFFVLKALKVIVAPENVVLQPLHLLKALWFATHNKIIGSLSNPVCEMRTATGSTIFSVFFVLRGIGFLLQLFFFL